MSKTISRETLLAYCEKRLVPEQFKDYAPNGLQVEGKANIGKIVSGVTASQSLIDAAIEAQADLLLVHHGYFWPGEDPCVVGMKQRRIKALLLNDINLVGYHLPLDAHAEIGNNAQLAKLLGVSFDGNTGKQGLLCYGRLPEPMDVSSLRALVSNRLAREPLIVGPQDKVIETVAWCTGGAQSYIHDAVALGVDAFISGEISEQTTHVAQENDLIYVAAGHHATERYGVKALGEELAAEFNLAHQFIDVQNPV